MWNNRMVFEMECRNCNHTVHRTFEANRKNINDGENTKRIRCKKCRTINYIEQSGTIDDETPTQ